MLCPGQRGTVVSYAKDNGRYRVTLDNSVNISIRPINLEAAAPEAVRLRCLTAFHAPRGIARSCWPGREVRGDLTSDVVQ